MFYRVFVLTLGALASSASQRDCGEALSLPTFDDRGRLERFTDALGNPTAYLYSDDGLTETRINTYGGTFTTTYDPRGNVTRTVNEIGAVSTTVYDEKDRPIVVTPECACTTSNRFDARGNLVERTDDLGHTTRYTYDANNNPLSVTDPLGSTERYEYDAYGNLTARTDAAGHKTQFQSDDYGRVTSVRQPDGRTFGFGYEPPGPGVMLSAQPNAFVLPGGITHRMTYNAFGRPNLYIDAEGHTNRFETDDAGRLTARSDGLGNTFRYRYNTNGALDQVTDPLGHVTGIDYDAAFRIVAVRDPNGGTNQYHYDALGRLTNLVDQIGRNSFRAYRADGALMSITDNAGHTVHFEYDNAKNRTALSDPNNNRTEFRYDGLNRLITEVDPLGKARFFSYDAAGNQTAITDRLNRTRRFDFDALNRPVRETWIETNAVVRVIETQFDPAGRPVMMEDPDSRHEMTYDAVGRLETISRWLPGDTAPFVLNYAYDGNSRVTRTWDGEGVTVASTYDPAGRLATRAWSGGGVTPADVALAYNALGDLTNIVRFANGMPSVQTAYEFARGKADLGAQTALFEGESLAWLDQIRPLKARGPLAVEPDHAELLGPSVETLRRMTALTHTAPSGDVLGFYRYQFDPAGQLLAESNHVETVAYTHDPIGQLTGADRSVLPDETYSYDPAGNRTLSVTSVSSLFTNTYSTGPANRILSDGEHTYTHDDEGNLVGKTHLTTGERWVYTFDHRNRLTAAIQSDASGHESLGVTFAYDPTGRRIAKTVTENGTTKTENYCHDRDNLWTGLLTESGTRETVRYLYTERVDQAIARHDSENGVQWYLPNRLGSVSQEANPLGEIVQAADYTAFGEDRDHGNGALDERLGFVARELDRETSFSFFRNRYYVPSLGRFATEDPTRFLYGELLLYGYAINGPDVLIDPFGLAAAEENNSLISRVAIRLKSALCSLAENYFAAQEHLYREVYRLGPVRHVLNPIAMPPPWMASWNAANKKAAPAAKGLPQQ
ncbi:MAG TPA: RHS repeat-associated core domain-containing protein [Verrucomicrobiae bacterium]|nr:RHS repeat-associated core domain-containing protein [Verrucomicrobiae bacterium]